MAHFKNVGRHHWGFELGPSDCVGIGSIGVMYKTIKRKIEATADLAAPIATLFLATL